VIFKTCLKLYNIIHTCENTGSNSLQLAIGYNICGENVFRAKNRMCKLTGTSMYKYLLYVYSMILKQTFSTQN